MTKFLHTCVRVKDLEASLNFYQDALGFKEVRRNDFPEYKFTLVYLQLEDDPDYELELTYNYDHEKCTTLSLIQMAIRLKLSAWLSS